MRALLLSGFLALLAVACHSGTDRPAALPAGGLPALQGTWLLVPEASHADTLAYRRSTYRFRYRPQGRPGFRLGPAGRFMRYDVAPGGGLLAHEGIWKAVGRNRLRIHLFEIELAGPDYELEVLAYQKGLLRLRRHVAQPASQ